MWNLTMISRRSNQERNLTFPCGLQGAHNGSNPLMTNKEIHLLPATIASTRTGGSPWNLLTSNGTGLNGTVIPNALAIGSRKRMPLIKAAMIWDAPIWSLLHQPRYNWKNQPKHNSVQNLVA